MQSIKRLYQRFANKVKLKASHICYNPFNFMLTQNVALESICYCFSCPTSAWWPVPGQQEGPRSKALGLGAFVWGEESECHIQDRARSCSPPASTQVEKGRERHQGSLLGLSPNTSHSTTAPTKVRLPYVGLLWCTAHLPFGAQLRNI